MMSYQLSTRCFICGKHDENEDPTLRISCTPDDPSDQCCRLSCHIDCAFESECVGVTSNSQFKPLDAYYWCISCGKFSDLLGYWRQQVSLAKDDRFVEDLCKRLSLYYKLMNGTARYVALHENVILAKAMVEAELSEPGSSCSCRAVNGLSVADQVHKLCADAIDKADELMAIPELEHRVGSIPPACRVIFEEISSVSIRIILVNIPTARTETPKGFNIWCWRSKEEISLHKSREDLSFPPLKNRAHISNLHPSTKYAIRVVSYINKVSSCGITEVKCKTPPALVAEAELDQDEVATNIVPSKLVDIPDLNDDATNNPSIEPPVLVDIPDLNTDIMELVRDLDDELGIPDLNEEPSTNGLKEKEVVTESMVEEDVAGPSTPATTKGVSRTECVAVIRNLERKVFIREEFRMEFLTWFGFKAKEQEREVVYAYIEALSDQPQSLARQLIHSFSDIRNKQGSEL